MAVRWRGYGQKTLGIALVGTGFMGSVHARAYRAIPYLYPDEVRPSLQLVVDVTDDAARAAAQRWEVPHWTSRWEAVLADDSIDIVDICTPPTLHRPIGIAAAGAGKHIYCEKPQGRTSADAQALFEAVDRHAVAGFVGFNYRWAPAVVYAQELIAHGDLGALRHLRIAFNSDWAADPNVAWSWRFDRAGAGYGALADVGSHVVDMARFLAGEITHVTGLVGQSIFQRPVANPAGGQTHLREVDNDDQWAALAKFSGGATGVLEGSRVATGSKTHFAFEVTGARGAVRWDFERMNELDVYLPRDDARLDGVTRVLIGPQHPLQGAFVPQAGIGIGFLETKVLEIRALLNGVSAGTAVAPTFEDGLKVARILDRIAADE